MTLTKNELITALNSPEQFILALVEIDGGEATDVRYLPGYDFKEPRPPSSTLSSCLTQAQRRAD